jgi:hypothetical protein
MQDPDSSVEIRKRALTFSAPSAGLREALHSCIGSGTLSHTMSYQLELLRLAKHCGLAPGVAGTGSNLLACASSLRPARPRRADLRAAPFMVRWGSKTALTAPKRHFRGRDASYLAPPTGSPEAVARPRLPQNVACGFPAPRSSAVGSQLSLLSVQVSFPWSADLLSE